MAKASWSGKRRSEPWWPAGVVVLLGMVGLIRTEAAPAAEATSRPANPQAALEAKLQELHAQGEAVWPADLARPAVRDEENAVIDLRRAAADLKQHPQALEAYDNYKGPMVPAPPQLMKILQQVVGENRKALESIDAAFKKPKVDWQLKLQSPLFTMLLPHLAEQRKLAHLLTAAAILAHEQGNDRQALVRVQQMDFIARCLDQQPLLISHLVATAIRSQAAETCGLTATGLRMDAADPAMARVISDLIHELLDDQAAKEGLQWAMRGERVMHVDAVLAIASGKIKPQELMPQASPGRQSPQPLDEEQFKLDALIDARQMLEDDSVLIAAAGAVNWPIAKAKLAARQPLPAGQGTGHVVTSALTAAYDKALLAHFTALARRRLAATALAVRWYCLEHDGKLPATLEELVPRYLPRVPDDPLTMEATLSYVPDRKIVYSVGKDGIEDGGMTDPQTPNEPDLVVRLAE